MAREYTPDPLYFLPPEGIFVFGSNAEGIHGKGAARDAVKYFGAKRGQAEGLQGQSYAIITKADWRRAKSSTLDEIKTGIHLFLIFARGATSKKFYVTKIGSSNAGYTIEEIKSLFKYFQAIIPDNVILPEEYEVRNP